MSLMISALHQPAAACAVHAARAAIAVGARHASRRVAASALRSVTSNRSALATATAPARGFLTVVPQATVAYRQFLGGGRTRLNPGLHLNLPIFHQITAVDMREGRIDMENLSAVSKDNIMVWITGTLFYQGQRTRGTQERTAALLNCPPLILFPRVLCCSVRDAEKACFGVQDYINAVSKVGTSSIRSVIGCKEYDSINSERNEVNAALAKTIASSIDQWGVECTRFEIQAITPQSKEVAKQLELQMEAERLKRKNVLDTEAHVKTSEGQKQSAILVSEGHLQARRNEAEGDLIVEQRRADARQYATDTEAAALARQLKAIAVALDGDTKLAVQFLIEQQKLKHMAAMATASKQSQTYIVPSSNDVFASSKVISDMFAAKTNTHQ